MNWTMQDDYLNWNGIISNEDEKINIAKKVAEKVKDGEVIGFGSGSTSFLTIIILSRMMLVLLLFLNFHFLFF